MDGFRRLCQHRAREKKEDGHAGRLLLENHS
jgi:hypothetical protein